MSDENEKLIQQFRITQEKYRLKLPAKIAQIESLFALFKKDPADTHHLPELTSLVHNLSGSAATFGFSKLGDCARHIEQLLGAETCNTMSIENNVAKLQSLLKSVDPEAETLKKTFGVTL